jgi:hypothetical protein
VTLPIHMDVALLKPKAEFFEILFLLWPELNTPSCDELFFLHSLTEHFICLENSYPSTVLLHWPRVSQKPLLQCQLSTEAWRYPVDSRTFWEST